MAIEESLLSHLVTGPTSAGSRVYPVRLPNPATMPALVYQRLPLGEFFGAHDGPTGLVRSVFQITAWGSKYAEAKTLAGEVVPLFDNRRGTIGATSNVVSRIVGDPLDNYDPDGQLYQTITQVELWHKPAGD